MIVLGFDIGGTKCAAIIARIQGDSISLLASEQIQTNPDWQTVLDELCVVSEKFMIQLGIEIRDIDSIGVSCGGPLDGQRGIILSPPNLPGWDKVPVTDYLTRRFHKTVRLKNDADACAIAEWKYGAGKGCHHMIFLTFGTGLGAGLILDDKLYTGASNMAGEVGHIRLTENGPIGYGKAGSFEGYCSGAGIRQIGIRLASERLAVGERVSFCKNEQALESITARMIAQQAMTGSEDAREVYRISGHYFGRGLSILIDLLNPEKIVVGSIYARSRDLLYEEMISQLQKECLQQSLEACTIVPAELGEDIGNYAAVVAALDV